MLGTFFFWSFFGALSLTFFGPLCLLTLIHVVVVVVSPITEPFNRRALLCYVLTAVGSAALTLAISLVLEIKIFGGMYDFPLYLAASHLVLAPVFWLLVCSHFSRNSAV
jgi:hypothetical protein